MKIVNILFNHKKSKSDNHILGVERCFIDYAKYLILQGHQLLSITKNKMVFKDDVKKTGSKFLEVAAFGQGDIWSILIIAFAFIKFAPDVAICHSGRAMFFARLARILSFRKFPIVAIDHGINPKKFLKADYVLTVNSYFSKELIKAGKAPETALVIPNMMEVPKNFVPLVKPPFRHPIKIGSLGRLYPEKYFDKMIRALAILRDWGIACEYVIGGVGHQENYLNNLAQELGVEKNFKILGWVSDKKTFFENIDIFILPSFGETFGIVLLEAMLYKTPIITSNSWGPDEIITDKINGLKVPREDEEKMPQLIAQAIKTLIDDQDFAKKLAENAYETFFKNYSCEMVGKKLSDILQNIVAQKHR
ncbi:MAG: glycosyltransferase family 4 protein [Rickettsiales bacterium]|nr:glycosyltransferase family 4 protein [Rickettsiales bacterium]